MRLPFVWNKGKRLVWLDVLCDASSDVSDLALFSRNKTDMTRNIIQRDGVIWCLLNLLRATVLESYPKNDTLLIPTVLVAIYSGLQAAL